MDFYIKNNKNNYEATISYENGKFILKAGSSVSKRVSARFKSNNKVIKRRKEAGIDENNCILQKDMVFSSSTVAGEFVCGTSCNGPSSWKNKEGLTLKEWMESNGKKN